MIKRVNDEGLSVKATEELVEKELSKLYGEEKEQKLKFKINYRLYFNSVRKLVSRFKALGEDASCNYEEEDDTVKITISFNKRKNA